MFNPKKDNEAIEIGLACLKDLQNAGYDQWSINEWSNRIPSNVAAVMREQGIKNISKSKTTGSTFITFTRERNDFNIKNSSFLNGPKRNNDDI